MLKISERAVVLGALAAFVALPLISSNIAVAQMSAPTVTPHTAPAATQNATSSMSMQAEEAAGQGKGSMAEEKKKMAEEKKQMADKAAKEAMEKGK
jgi:hypothetical protein